jgi:hypothetical protein
VNADEVVGTPREYEVWLAPDWSDYNEKQKKASTWTRVSVRETLYADGRRITQVLDENRAPITTRALAEDRDAAQEKRFKDAQTTASRETAQAERKETRTYTGTDPQTGRPATVTEYESGPPKYDEIKPAGAAGAKEWRTEGTPDGQGGFDNSRPIMAAYVNGQRTGETRAANAKELEDWNLAGQMTRNPGGKTDAQLAADAKATDDKARQQAADARAVAAANKPGAPTLKPDGKGGTIAIQVMPDGTIKETPLPGVPSEATRVTVEGVVYEKGPDGKFAPAAGIPLPGASAKNIEPFVPDPSQPDLGLGAWAAAQRARIGQPSEAGGITQSEYDQAVKAGHDQATVYIQNVTSSQTVRRQAEQDERGQRKDLSEQSAGDYGRAQGIFSEILQYTKPGSRAIMDVIPGIMAEQARFRQQREQTARAAPPLHPMFQVMPQAAGVAPAAAPAAPLPPEQAAAVGPPPEIPMTPERVQGIMQNPVFRPQPMVAAPAAPPPLGQGQDLSTPVSMAPPEPGMVSAWAGPMVAPPQPAPIASQPVLALPQQAPAPMFDPMQTAGKLAQWGVPAEVVAQALQEMGIG